MVVVDNELNNAALWYAWGHIDAGNYPVEIGTDYGVAFRKWYNERMTHYRAGDIGMMPGMQQLWFSFVAGGRTDFGN